MPGETGDRRVTGGSDPTRTVEKRKADEETRELEVKRHDHDANGHDVVAGGKLARICEPELEVISDQGENEPEENGAEKEVDILASGLEENETPGEKNGSDGDLLNQDEESSFLEEHEEDVGDGLSLLTVGVRKCSQEIVHLRKENQYLNRRLEEVNQRNRQLQELQKISFVKVKNVCPPAGEENNPSVVAGKVLPILCARGYVKLDNLLKCRLVCRNWRPEVDHFLETSFSSPEFDKKERQLEKRRWAYKVLPDVSKDETDKLGQAYKFHCPSRVQEFLGKFEDFEGNPFLGRIARFKVTEEDLRNNSDNDPEDEVKLYWELVGKLLEKFGEHLWYVTINQDDLGLTSLKLYKLLEKILPLVKNVKCLEVYGKYEEALLKTESQSDLSQYMATKLLPPFPILRSLNFQFPTTGILDAILKISPSLSELAVFESKVSLWEIKTSVGKLALKQLTWFTRPSEYKSLFFVSKNLEKLHLDFSSRGGHSAGKIGLGELLLVLKQFPKLSELKLKGTIGLEGGTLQNLSIETLKLLNCYDDKKEKKGVLVDVKKREGFYAQIMFHFPNLRFLFIEDLVWEFDVWERFKSLEAMDLNTTYHIATATTTTSGGTPIRGKTRTNRISWRK